MQSQSFGRQLWSSRCGSSMAAQSLDTILIFVHHEYTMVCSGGTLADI